MCLHDFWNAKHAELLRLAKKTVGDEADDLIGDIALWTFTNQKAQRLCERGELAYYLVGIIRISGFSPTSPHQRKYRKRNKPLPTNLTQPEDETSEIEEEQLRWIQAELGQLRWFDARLFELYHTTKHTYSTLSKETGIARTTIHKSVTRTTAYLRQAARTRGHDSSGHQGNWDRQAGENHSR